MQIFTFFTEAQLTARWGISKRTLQKWRATGIGPKHRKLGMKIFYSSTVVELFENPTRKRCMATCTNDFLLCSTEKFKAH